MICLNNKDRDSYFALGNTLILEKGNDIILKSGKGIKPLLELIKEGKDLSGYKAYDLVTGRAAAFLYNILNIKEVNTKLLSEKAIEILDKYGIKFEAEETVPHILNIPKNDICPMEKIAISSSESEECYNKIIDFIKSKQ